MQNTVVIAGATGVVGNAALDHYLEAGWNVIALSRRVPQTSSTRPFQHIAVDLRDKAACQEALGGLRDVTQLIYAALFELPGLVAGWSEKEQMTTNEAMLRHTIESLENSKLSHVVLLQGTKAYGVHVRPLRIPAKEKQPRVVHENFYWLQEDYLVNAAQRYGFSYTIFRPQFIFGGVVGAAMNLVPVIAIYGALRRAEGKPFSYPGGRSFVAEASDPRQLAQAMMWSLESESARNETFNITNGDVFEWRDVWPAIGNFLGLEMGPDEKMSLAQYLPAKASDWAEIVAANRLQDMPLSSYLGESHHYADYAFAYEADDRGSDHGSAPAFLSAIKIRAAGFTPVYDTEDSLGYWINVLRERKLLPN